MPAAVAHELHTKTATFMKKNRLALVAIVLAALGPLTGCAQQKEAGYYDPPTASTVTDAEYQGTGAGYRSVVRAPSQLQIDLKRPSPGQQQQQAAQQVQAQRDGRTSEDGQAIPVSAAASEDTASGQPPPRPSSSSASKLVPQPQTYMGTLPCFSAGLNCVAQRITLTLAPNGRWRGRSAYLDEDPQKGKPVTEQGCWEASDEKPPRVFLTGADGNARAEFVLAANNVLRLRAISGVTPNLTYTLTRQPDLDPINELSPQTAPKCS